jgi:hypothetical protein
MQLEQSPKKDLILSVFMYDTFVEGAARFLVSVREFCPAETTDIVLFVKPQVDPKFAEFARSLQVQLIPIRSLHNEICQGFFLKTVYRLFMGTLELGAKAGAKGFDPVYRAVASSWFHTTNARYFAYQDFLNVNSNYRCVLLSDSRDVVFQANPFPHVDPNIVHVFEHDPSIIFGDEDINRGGLDTQWTIGLYGKKIANDLKGKPVTCVGTIMGSPEVLLNYMAIMETEILSHKRGTLEQPIQNKLIYLDLPNELFRIHPNSDGLILTLHAVDSKTYEVNETQVKVNGKVVPILHQYDRIPNLESLFEGLYPISMAS